MIEKLTITRIHKSDKDKEGKLLKTKDGRAYTRIGIQTKEYGAKWLSGFVGYWNENWVEGQIVGATVEPNGDFLNLKKPDPVDELRQEFKARIEALEQAIFNQHEIPQSGHVEEQDRDNSNLPF